MHSFKWFATLQLTPLHHFHIVKHMGAYWFRPYFPATWTKPKTKLVLRNTQEPAKTRSCKRTPRQTKQRNPRTDFELELQQSSSKQQSKDAKTKAGASLSLSSKSVPRKTQEHSNRLWCVTPVTTVRADNWTKQKKKTTIHKPEPVHLSMGCPEKKIRNSTESKHKRQEAVQESFMSVRSKVRWLTSVSKSIRNQCRTQLAIDFYLK